MFNFSGENEDDEGFLTALKKGYEMVKGENESFEIALFFGESIVEYGED